MDPDKEKQLEERIKQATDLQYHAKARLVRWYIPPDQLDAYDLRVDFSDDSRLRESFAKIRWGKDVVYKSTVYTHKRGTPRTSLVIESYIPGGWQDSFERLYLEAIENQKNATAMDEKRQNEEDVKKLKRFGLS